MTVFRQSNAAPAATRSRIPALVGIGTFVVLVGIVAPKLMTPLAGTATDSSTVAPTPSTTDGADEQTQASSQTATANVLRPIEQIMIGVSIVIALGIGAIWLFSRQRSAAALPGPALLNVTAVLPLRHHCWAYLVEVGGQQFLAGVDPTGIRSVLPLPSVPNEPVEERQPLLRPVLAPTLFPPVVLGGKR